jgi:hypothetical protein
MEQTISLTISLEGRVGGAADLQASGSSPQRCRLVEAKQGG